MATATENKQNVNKEQSVLADLQKAYLMEMETVANYLADSVNLDGVLAEEIKKSLAEDVQEELGHAQRLAQRIKQLGGHVPGPTDLRFSHSHLGRGEDTTDVEAVVRGVLADEEAAINHYRKIIRATNGEDFVTQDLCINLLADEEEHRTQFRGFLKEYTG